MYDLHSSTVRESLINPVNASFVLAAACFFEMTDLADFCIDYILTGMNPDTISKFIDQLDRLCLLDTHATKASLDQEHQYGGLIREHHKILEKSCLSYLYQLVSALGFESTLKDNAGPMVNKRKDPVAPLYKWKSAEHFLATLPLGWIKKITDSDTLCLESEYARYISLKLIFEYRIQRFDEIKQEDAESNKDPFEDVMDSPSEYASESGLPRDESYSGFLGSMLGNVLPSSTKKRKRDTALREDILKTQTLEKLSTPLKRPASRSASRVFYDYENGIKLELFTSNIIYTHMTFHQLQVVKKDGIVPEEVLLMSLWDQTEFLHSLDPNSSKKVPRFRFAVRFTNLQDLFPTTTGDDKKSGDKSIFSEPIMCAGAQYRVILCREETKAIPERSAPIQVEDDQTESALSDAAPKGGKPVIKALLQRTRAASASTSTQARIEIAYSVYAFDRSAFMKGRIQDTSFFDPLTVCGFDGGGQAKALPLSMVHPDESSSRKSKSKDLWASHVDLWLMVIIQFK